MSVTSKRVYEYNNCDVDSVKVANSYNHLRTNELLTSGGLRSRARSLLEKDLPQSLFSYIHEYSVSCLGFNHNTPQSLKFDIKSGNYHEARSELSSFGHVKWISTGTKHVNANRNFIGCFQPSCLE